MSNTHSAPLQKPSDEEAASSALPTPRYVSITGSPPSGEDSPDTTRRLTPIEARGDYGTMDNRESQGLAQRQPVSLRQLDSTSASRPDLPASPPSMQPLSPQVTKPPKKPATLRRTSTLRKPIPHRGEFFSVDDDPSEIEDARGPPAPYGPNMAPLTRQTSTVRRRPTQQVVPLARVDSQEEDEAVLSRPTTSGARQPSLVDDADNEDEADMGDDEQALDEDDADISDTESFTLRDRQLAINETHPFGIRIWKPALYKKNRSVEKDAEQDIHSSPSAIVSNWLWAFNCLWTLLFGWWLALAAWFASLVCFVFAAFEPSCYEYSKVFWGLAGYLFWPFGKFVKLEQDENYVDEDEGEGRSISEYERWQSGDLEYGRLMFGPPVQNIGSIIGRHRNSMDSLSERDSLLARSGRGDNSETEAGARSKRRLFGRGQWTFGRVVFFIVFYFLVAPLMLVVSIICWLLVVSIPMGRVNMILLYHLRKRPLSLTFHRDASHARSSTHPSSILLCTYRAGGLKYWKYTIDGTNVVLVNFLAVVVFVCVDYFLLKVVLHIESWLTGPALLFALALVSVIPLAYFIGQAVASISAQSSMGMGAAINAFFSTIVEVYLYCIALNEGKGQLVEGSLIGSIFAGVLLLPGLSMCFGAINRKTQRFNVKSAGATSTMLLFATIAAFGPTLFYKIYGAHELICKSCFTSDFEEPRDCRQCYFRQVPAINDAFFVQAVRPYCWFAAFLLFASYIIGLLFTLRTHAAVIWTTDSDEKKPVPPSAAPATTDISPFDTRRQSTGNTMNTVLPNGPPTPRPSIHDSQLYKRILGQSLRQVGLPSLAADAGTEHDSTLKSTTGSHTSGNDRQKNSGLPFVVPPKGSIGEPSLASPGIAHLIPGLSEEQNARLVRQVAEMAATAATVAARDASQQNRNASSQQTPGQSLRRVETHKGSRPTPARGSTFLDQAQNVTTPAAENAVAAGGAAGGHDAPNWSRTKSAVILLSATLAYALVAEVLVNTVDVVLQSVDIDEKFLGITLFALVPNTTEFLNGISFAMNGNIALSMEIGSAYALQVCLLQIPTLVLYSAVYGRYIDPTDLIDHTFQLIFPQWDMVTVILCVFLLSYMYGEGKSNYFKGSILVLTYLVVVMGFYFSSYTSMDVEGMGIGSGVDWSDTLAVMGSMSRSVMQPGATSRATAKPDL